MSGESKPEDIAREAAERICSRSEWMPDEVLDVFNAAFAKLELERMEAISSAVEARDKRIAELEAEATTRFQAYVHSVSLLRESIEGAITTAVEAARAEEKAKVDAALQVGDQFYRDYYDYDEAHDVPSLAKRFVVAWREVRARGKETV